ncbi:alpha/beta-hydrolase [Conidiobolus coronatus NRRL 28638]|uniref:Alpha/beta-hydrolase n=1 Tax=Conidiobolus coronatus (strain ATCC 28846 / CBS 209.66 / NRRL 28638) TaxID=796925 RepID=A0A137NX10_CONC2|nr:alpha/beta-hydrolase [Conidiobolus coronatus NRRL 28638]|eukprot:KXN67211.1 alpha/beta-hydrolase [Conidiobolus coronatus NRRL 28638]
MRLINLLQLIYISSYHSLTNPKIKIAGSNQIGLKANELKGMIKILKSGPNINDFVEPVITKKGNDKDMMDMFFFSNAAYCDLQMISAWSCKLCTPVDKSLKMSEVFPITAMGDDLFGYVGESKGRIILAFRGTQNAANVVTDLNLVTDTYTTRKGVEFSIHKGFKKAVELLLPTAVEHLKYFKRKYPYAPIYITGHSLGGGIANLLSMYLEDLGHTQWKNTHVYTYGQPRVGDQRYADYIDTRKGATFLRVVTEGDIFTNLPTRLQDYSHNGHLNFRVNNIEVKECDTPMEQPKCYGFIDAVAIRDHVLYLGYDMSIDCVDIGGTGALKLLKYLDPLILNRLNDLPI